MDDSEIEKYRQQQYDEIQSLTNPVVKRKLLEAWEKDMMHNEDGKISTSSLKWASFKQKVRKYSPYVNVAVSSLAIGVAAMYASKYNRELQVNKDQIVLDPTPRLLQAVREQGAVLKFKIDEHGTHHYTTEEDFPQN